MEHRRRIPRLCFLSTAALILVGVILRAVCMLCLFDPDIGYFKNGLLPTLSNVLYFIAVLVPLVCMFLTPKGTLPLELNTPGRIYPALALGIALGAFTVANLIAPDLLAGIPEQFLSSPVQSSADSMAAKTASAASLLAFPAAFYFLASARKNGRYPDWLAFLGYLPVIWCIAAVGNTYFDRYVAMNSPVKIALQFGFLGFMLILLAELRFRVGKAFPRYSVVFLSVGSYTCLVGSIPLLIAVCAGVLAHPRYTLYAAVLLCAGLYGLYLLFRYTASRASLPVLSPEAAPTETPNTAE